MYTQRLIGQSSAERERDRERDRERGRKESKHNCTDVITLTFLATEVYYH